MATRKTTLAKAKKTTPHPKPLSTKKILATELIELMTPGLAKWKKLMGEEKFEKKIKKAAKILSQGIPSVKGKTVAEKKPVLAKAKKTLSKKSGIKKKKA